VKSMELMDIRDSASNKSIANIMAKRTSHIEMESRMTVAENHRLAKVAEITAQRVVDVSAQEAEQLVGQRVAEKDQAVGIARQQAQQEVLAQERETRERTMAVQRVDQVRAAENTRDQQLVVAEQDQKTLVIRADGTLEAKRREATGIQVEGEARASAQELMLLAPVHAQTTLAKEIGSNQGYQEYLVRIESVKAHVVVGTEQAKALQTAQIKVIVNAGDPGQGVQDVMSLFSSKGGTAIASMVEAAGQTPLGSAALRAIGVRDNGPLVEPEVS